MDNELKFIGWEAEGLRCPDHRIDLRNGASPHPIVLIQMPNGTGKTTTLKLLRAAMSGKAEDWDSEQVRPFRKKNPKTDRGRFKVHFLVGDKRATIRLHLDFRNGKVQYETTYRSGNEVGFQPPRDLRRFITPWFVRFYIFDGELADKLLDPSETDAEQAIENLFQIRLLDTMKSRVEDYWEEETTDQRVTKSSRLGKQRRKYRKAKERLQFLKKQKAEDEQRLAKLREELEEKEEEFREEISNQEELNERLVTATENHTQAEGEVEQTAERVLRQMRNPRALSSSFAEEMIDLRANLDSVKLPERSSREFFTELARDEEKCICGRDLDEEHREIIRERAERYLGSDDNAFLNNMKEEIGYIEENPEEDESNLESEIGELVDAVAERQRWRQGLDDVEDEGARDDPKAAQVREEVNDLEDEIDRLEEKMRKYDRRDDTPAIDEAWGIEVVKKRVERHEKKVGEIADALNLLEKRKYLQSILRDANERAHESISDEVCSQANQRIQTLMPDNDIRIDGIDDCLRLQNQGAGSAGETLTVGYAFLSTLFNLSSYRLPFIVDSPANPIDLNIRDQVGSIVPQLANQFVAFTISSERQGFVTALQEKAEEVGQEVKFVTLFRKGVEEAEEQIGNDSPTQITESEDGWRVEGQSFFHHFQLEREPE